jgi:hypothetical protein
LGKHKWLQENARIQGTELAPRPKGHAREKSEIEGSDTEEEVDQSDFQEKMARNCQGRREGI